ncbi:peptide ABC transporter substrate-binding protein [Gephyromycinifex aptenodytis]|uniref:peptide ABC transporter substrate-binding protein n=1 Tax=Gephyromycinifex aptenodytis TaxID=2716227 RepID=UPI0014471C41|nr:ABC transporter substrate-binding protein [Gephyromycinifex aptenodytis]
MRRARTRFLAMAGAAVISTMTLATGCAPEPAPPAATTTRPSNAPIVVNAREFTRDLHPARVDDPYGSRITALLFRGLLRYDAKGKAVNEVAESIETTDDQFFRVRLASGWRFSNGEPVTAASFVDAWSLAAAPDPAHVHRWLFSPILGADTPTGQSQDEPGAASTSDSGGPRHEPRLSGLRVLDERTFTIRLRTPQPGFTDRLGHQAFAPLPRVAFTDPQAFTDKPIGNGPYLLTEGWQQADTLRLRPSSAYAGADPATNTGIDFRLYADLDAARRDLDSGALDVLDDLPLSDLPTYRTELGERAINQPVGRTVGIVVPTRARGWGGAAGLAARQALSMSIDRSEIATTVFADTRVPATDLAAPVVEGYSRSLCGALCTADPAGAATALATSRSAPTELTLAFNSDAGHAPWVDEVCAGVTAALGIRCEPRPYPTLPALQEAVATGQEPGPYVQVYQMDYPALESFLAPRFIAGAAGNDSGYADPRALMALTHAREVPLSEKVGAYVQAETIVLHDLPVVPLWTLNATAAYGTGVTGMRTDVFGVPIYTQIHRG